VDIANESMHSILVRQWEIKQLQVHINTTPNKPSLFALEKKQSVQSLDEDQFIKGL
jgi:hypothetical protein